MKTLIFLLLVTLFVTQSPTAQQAAEELLAADRAFAAAGAKTELIPALTSMFSADVAMMAPEIAYSAATAAEYLKANPANHGARVAWSPARVGVSADGKHGFTAGVKR